jgi:TLC domain
VVLRHHLLLARLPQPAHLVSPWGYLIPVKYGRLSPTAAYIRSSLFMDVSVYPLTIIGWLDGGSCFSLGIAWLCTFFLCQPVGTPAPFARDLVPVATQMRVRLPVCLSFCRSIGAASGPTRRRRHSISPFWCPAARVEHSFVGRSAGRQELRWLYLLELAFYLASSVMLIFWETRRKDFMAMAVHHLATVVLIERSFYLKCVVGVSSWTFGPYSA